MCYNAFQLKGIPDKPTIVLPTELPLQSLIVKAVQTAHLLPSSSLQCPSGIHASLVWRGGNNNIICLAKGCLPPEPRLCRQAGFMYLCVPCSQDFRCSEAATACCEAANPAWFILPEGSGSKIWDSTDLLADSITLRVTVGLHIQYPIVSHIHQKTNTRMWVTTASADVKVGLFQLLMCCERSALKPQLVLPGFVTQSILVLKPV